MIGLAIGDVVGEPGLKMLETHVFSLRRLYDVDLVVANGENADMLGIRPEQAERMSSAGVDVITLGNHTWRRREIARVLDDRPRLLRPANFPSQNPGAGHFVFITNRGVRVCVISLVGRCLMDFHPDNPFLVADRLLAQTEADLFVIDFHAETTSEKAALAHHLDGRAQMVFGTHTHVQTADERVLPGGLGFLTDIGMTGPAHSVLGIKPEQSVASFLGDLPQRFEAAPGPAKLEGALFEIDEQTHRCTAVRRLAING
ncbi:MAG: TIGR00282 family metallophosphoesterase [Oscillospiraceae bacterium]|jgi:metallophosphoesterase (TIGR00282 family)|nr:TIGR00282 family metallophosphoesterase [Oscillospiraceae bacterium]